MTEPHWNLALVSVLPPGRGLTSGPRSRNGSPTARASGPGSLGKSAGTGSAVAPPVGNLALMAMFEDAALAQYVFRRHAYDRAWPDQIPAGLKTLADAFLSQIAPED